MRVLWVTPAFPDLQGSGGQLHEFELLRAVAPRHDITLFATLWYIRPGALREVSDLGVKVRFIPWPWAQAEARRMKVTKFVRLALGASPNVVVSNRAKRLPPLAVEVQTEERAHPVDIVQIIQGDLAPMTAVARAPTALLLYDIYGRLADLVLKESRPPLPRRIRYHLERRNARRWESHWYRQADGIACVSPVDAEIASSLVGRPVETIPNPVPDEFFAPPSVERSRATVTFVGSFGWEPNVDSVEWLCEEIWPQILDKRPDAKLRVAGRFASPELQRTVASVGGEFLLDVEDIRPSYWDAAVVIAPIRMGSGTRNKILHAMACGAPLVATPSALEGIPATHGEHLLVADDAAGLAAAVVEALNDPKAAAARAETAKAIPLEFSAAAAGRRLEAWWESTIAAAKANGREARSPAQVRAPSFQPASDRTPPVASIVVCTRNRPELLRTCLESIRAAVEAAGGAQVVVVEQGEPSAGTICASVGLDATVVPDAGVGASRARNVGTRSASGDVVLFTDDDCDVPLDWISNHVAALEEPDVIASFGPVVGIRYVEDSDPAAMPARHRLGSVPWIIGHASNMAVRRSAFEAVGGFDERIGPGVERATAGEDADLIARLLRTGSVLTSGTGQPVRHIDWRSSTERRENVIAYEHGAGVWIGKALREEPMSAISFLRARVQLQKDTVEYAKDFDDGSIPRSAFARAFARGILAGIRMRPWRKRHAGSP